MTTTAGHDHGHLGAVVLGTGTVYGGTRRVCCDCGTALPEQTRGRPRKRCDEHRAVALSGQIRAARRRWRVNARDAAREKRAAATASANTGPRTGPGRYPGTPATGGVDLKDTAGQTGITSILDIQVSSPASESHFLCPAFFSLSSKTPAFSLRFGRVSS